MTDFSYELCSGRPATQCANARRSEICFITPFPGDRKKDRNGTGDRKRMEGRKEGKKEGWMKGRKDERKEGRKEGRME